jgi:hypothetical protein
MSRQDQGAISVAIDGVNTGIWDKLSGGEVDSEETKYKPGAMANEISLGGSVNTGNVTVSRLYVLNRDHVNIKGWIARVGKAAVTVSKQPLDVDGNAFGDPLVYAGILKMVTPPELDSESNDAALVELEISTSGTVA